MNSTHQTIWPVCYVYLSLYIHYNSNYKLWLCFQYPTFVYCTLITHFHRVAQCTLKDRHSYKYRGPVFHHSYSSFPHSLQCDDKRETSLIDVYNCTVFSGLRIHVVWIAKKLALLHWNIMQWLGYRRPFTHRYIIMKNVHILIECMAKQPEM